MCVHDDLLFCFGENRKEKFVSDVMSVTQPVGGAVGLCLTDYID